MASKIITVKSENVEFEPEDTVADKLWKKYISCHPENQGIHNHKLGFILGVTVLNSHLENSGFSLNSIDLFSM